MPAFCGVTKCGNRSNRDCKSFFRLPTVPKKGNSEKIKLIEERREKWLASIKRADLNENKKKWLRVCEDHFISGKPAELFDVNHPDWVPSKNMGYFARVSTNALERHKRLESRKDKIVLKTQVGNSDNEDEEMQSGDESIDLPNSVLSGDESIDLPNSVLCQTDSSETFSIGTQTDLSGKDLLDNEKAYQDTVEDIAILRSKLSNITISEDSFKSDDEKTRYYSGLKNFQILMIVFDLLKEHLPHSPVSSLTRFQHFMLTMMRLRLNLEITDLAYRFGISKSTASRSFTTCINVMCRILENLVFWPERDVLMNNVPNSFMQTFGRKVTVIIDCFEIFIEKSSNLMAAAQTWSNYKHHNTIKYLIGICPQGAITYISPAWGGRSSDQHIAQNCGILDNLLPGDIVLCDRGFNINSHIEFYYAEVKIPAFTRGKKQLSAIEIEESRMISSVRIHVERVIGNLRQKYKILHNTMPISMISKINEDSTLVDQIVKVCCCLINISPSVIPFD